MSAAYDKVNDTPSHGLTDVCVAAFTPVVPLIGSIAAITSLVATLAQLFGPKPATRKDLLAVGTVLNRGAERRHGDDLAAHGTTHRLLSGDVAERAEAAFDARTLDPAQLARLRALGDMIEAETDATADQARLAAETAFTLERSEEAGDQAAARAAQRRDLTEAADLLIAEATQGKARNAERYRQAARLYAPSSPSRATDAYGEATQLDPTHVWSWIELGRLRFAYEDIDAARRCFDIARQHVTKSAIAGCSTWRWAISRGGGRSRRSTATF